MRLMYVASTVLLAAACFGQKIASQAVDPEIVPARDLVFDQRLDVTVPLDARFVDHNGNPVTLKDTFRGRPVVMGLIYYKCPSLCNQVLNGLVASLRSMNFTVGKEFDVVMVGIDPREEPITARAKLTSYLNRYGREDTEAGWTFLIGEENEVKRVARAVGYNYKFDIRRDQYAHPAGIIVLTPEGKTSKYFFGIEYSPRDLKFAVMDASEEKVGSLVEQAVAYCFLWDPDSGKYSLAILRVLQVGGLLTVLSIGGLVFFLSRKSGAEPTEEAAKE